MRKKLLATLTAFLLAILGFGYLPGDDADALRKKPGCGECVDGSFDYVTYDCAGSASDCTECTVCG